MRTFSIGMMVRLKPTDSSVPELLHGHCAEVKKSLPGGYRVYVHLPLAVQLVDGLKPEALEPLSPEAEARLRYLTSHWGQGSSEAAHLAEQYRERLSAIRALLIRNGFPQEWTTGLRALTIPHLEAAWGNRRIRDALGKRANLIKVWEAMREISRDLAEITASYAER